MDRPAEAIRAIVYLAAQQFHLYMISLPGQTLLDQSVELADKMYVSNTYKIKEVENSLHFTNEFHDRYDSNWYKIPTKFQKVLYLMQVRSNKPCILTAAGIYEMNIESFGIVRNNGN